MLSSRRSYVCMATLILAGLAVPVAGADESSAASIAPSAKPELSGEKVLTLGQCIEIALRQSHKKPASRFALAMAEAQHQQALAGYWPQVNFKAGYERLNQPLNFIFPASVMPVPSQAMTVAGGTAMVTIPANFLAPGFPPSSMQVPVTFPSQNIQTPAQNLLIPQENVKVLDDNVLSSSLDMKWLLYDGGMRAGYRQQASAAIEMARQEVRRTDLEITDTVKRYYWGAILARELRQLGEDTLARMEVTLRLTESLYKEGSGKVTKADYLDNDVMVETVRAMVAHLEENQKMAEAALANTMGYSWTESVRPRDDGIPFEPYSGDLGELVGTSYRFSPDWGKLENALKAAEGAVTAARSDYQPKIALTGELHRWWNGGYSSGMATAENRAGWTAGVGLEIPVFNGFLTRNKIAEARALVGQLKENELQLREGLGLQVKSLVMGLDAARKADQATDQAMQSAHENCDLNTRAYENGLVETEKVVKAQLMEALMSAQHHLARYEYASLMSQLSLVVGTEVQQTLLGVH